MWYIKCEVHWQLGEDTLNDRVFLFCIAGDCMSGKILDVKKLAETDYYELKVSFIDPKYFESVAYVGNKITVQEASKILGKGLITGLS